MVVFCKRDKILHLKPRRGKLSNPRKPPATETWSCSTSLLSSVRSCHFILVNFSLFICKTQRVAASSHDRPTVHCRVTNTAALKSWVDDFSWGHVDTAYTFLSQLWHVTDSSVTLSDLNYSSPQLSSFLKLVLSIRIQSGGLRHDISIHRYPHV